MRNAFAREITELASAREEIVLLMGDIGNRLFDQYKAAQAERFFNCGVGEANMVSVAAGMAANGLRPVCYTIAPFMTARCYEQIRIDICYHDMPVVIVGTGAGLSYASLGATHHSFDDIAMMRVLPEMKIFCPGDALEVRSCLRLALEQESPAYLRLGKKNEPLVHSSEPELREGRFFRIAEGARVCLLSCGNMLPEACAVREQLASGGIEAEVMSCFNVKPLDYEYLQEAFAKFDLVATIEEHSIIGGFGSAVAEWLADSEIGAAGKRARLLRFGIDDAFFHQTGEQAHLRQLTGLDAPSISGTILSALPSRS